MTKEFDPNYAHTVYFWLKNPDNLDDRQSFLKSLSTFLDTSKFAKTKFIGAPPKASREVVDDSFTFSLIVTFDSPVSQSSYQTEEAHNRFVAECESLWSKVAVYDSIAATQ